MTERQRKASGADAGTTAVLEAPRPVAPLSPTTPVLSWEDYFRHASPAQQKELLALARRQGLLYAHQLPPCGNGHAATDTDRTARWNTLNHLLINQRADLEPAAETAFEPFDTALDAHQRQAVARALGSPDVCIIIGWPGTGKSRVVSEILTQAAARGERILFAAPRPAPLDRVLPSLTGRDAVCPVRLLEPGTSIDGLPPVLRALTVVERSRFLREQVTQSALRCRDAAEAECRRRQQEEALWPRMQLLVEDLEELDKQLAELEACTARAAAEVDARFTNPAGAEPSDSETSIASVLRQQREALADLEGRQTEAERLVGETSSQLDEAVACVAKARPLAEAKAGGRWWTWRWWRATFAGNVSGRLAELKARQGDAEQALAAARTDAEAIVHERWRTEERHAAQIEGLKAHEVQRRQDEIAAQRAPLLERRRALLSQLEQTARGFSEEVRPTEYASVPLDAARVTWQNRRHHDEEQCKFACQWAGFVQQHAAQMEERVLGLVNLVAATPAALAQDKHFGALQAETFDALVLEDADQLTEAEFLKLARRAKRWVLVGEPAWEYAGTPA